MEEWADRARAETEGIMGAVPRKEPRADVRRSRPPTPAALARDMEDAKQARLRAERAEESAAVAEKDARNDLELAGKMGDLSLGKGRRTRRRRKSRRSRR